MFYTNTIEQTEHVLRRDFPFNDIEKNCFMCAMYHDSMTCATKMTRGMSPRT